MKFNFWIVTLLLTGASALAAHVNNSAIYQTDVKTPSGTSVYSFPLTHPSPGHVGVFNSDGESTSSTVTEADLILSILPVQGGNNGKVLGTNGSSTSWVTQPSPIPGPSGAPGPAGSPGPTGSPGPMPSIGTPDTSVQSNQGGVFTGDSNLIWDNSQKFLSVQAGPSPLAPLHVTGSIGTVVTPVPSATPSLVPDFSVDSPAVYAVSQVGGPAAPAISSTTLTYIETSNGTAVATQNVAETGYVATGQTLTYTLYGYKLAADGTVVVNPAPFVFTMTDMINDGTTTFGVDISSIAAPTGGIDGWILYKQDDQGYGPFWIKLVGAGVNSYTDLGYTNQDAYVATPYVANGSSDWSSGLAEYKNFAGLSNLRSAYTTNPQSDDSSGNGIILSTTWGAPVYDGFSVQFKSGGFQDVGTATSIDDYGQAGTGDTTSFDSVAFSNFNTTPMSPGSENSATQNDAETGYIADGSFTNHYYEVCEYRSNPVNGLKYFVTSCYTFGFSDNGDSSTYAVDIDLIPGDGDGRVLLYSLDNGSTYTQGVDLGAGTTYTDNNTAGTAPDINLLLSSYAGITRNFSLYGYVTSPSTKYSSTHNDQTFTDDNLAPYLIQHTYSGIGNALNGKIIESSYQDVHVIPDVAGGTIFEGPGQVDGNTVITPNVVGYLAVGQTHHYSFYVNKIIGAVSVWSQPFSFDQIFPNDGLYYSVNIPFTTVSGAAGYKAKRIINAGSPAYQTFSASPFEDTASTGWASSSTVTPTSAPVTAMIAERSMNGSFTDPAIATFRNTTASSGYRSFIEFQYNTGSGYDFASKWGTQGSGNAFVDSQSHGFEVGSIGSAHTRFQTSQSAFNLNSIAYEWFLKGQTLPFLLYGHSATGADSILLGGSGSANGYNALLNVNPNLDRQGVAVTVSGSATATTDSLRVESHAGSKLWGVDQLGHMAVGGNITAASSLIHVAGGDGTHTQIQLDDTTPLPSTPIAGGFERFDTNNFANSAATIGSQFTVTDKNLARFSLVTNVDPSTGGTGNSSQFWVTGNNGLPKPTSLLSLNSTNTLLIASIQSEFKASIATDNGIGVTVGGLLTAKAGTGSVTTVGGTLANHIVDAGNTTTAETTLYTDTLAANDLAANGQSIYAKYAGILVGSTSTKQIRVYLDGTLIFDSTALAVASSGHWEVNTACMRDTTTTARCSVTATIDGTTAVTSEVNYTTVTVANWTAGRILKITGTAASTGAATNDIVAKFGKVEYVP